MRPINEIIIHCTDTPSSWGANLTPQQQVAEIKRWHVEGNGWKDIGYHYVITRDGTVDGRDVSVDGAKLDGIEASATADQTAAEILTAIKTVDGSGSGLDADLLDGQEGSYYLNTTTTFGGNVSGTYDAIVVANDSHTHAFDNLTGKTSGTGDYTTTGTMTAATFNATSTTNGGFQGIDADSAANPSFTWSSDLDTGMYRTGSNSIGLATGGTLRLTVNSTGIISAGNVTAYSDERLKSDITTITHAVDKVQHLRGVMFTKDGEASTGVIAQEVQKVLPEVVNDKGEYLSVAYGNMVGLLIEAIKEQQDQIDDLKARLEVLE